MHEKRYEHITTVDTTELYDYLTNTLKKIPNSRMRPNVSGIGMIHTNIIKTGKNKGNVVKSIRGNLIQSLTLGKVRMRGSAHKNDWRHRKINKKYKQLRTHLDDIAKRSFPSFEYNAITVNHNLKTLPHKDKGNASSSVIFGVGDYTNGELIVEGEIVDIKNKAIKFDGTKHTHSTNDFKGDRWSFVFYMS